MVFQDRMAKEKLALKKELAREAKKVVNIEYMIICPNRFGFFFFFFFFFRFVFSQHESFGLLFSQHSGPYHPTPPVVPASLKVNSQIEIHRRSGKRRPDLRVPGGKEAVAGVAGISACHAAGAEQPAVRHRAARQESDGAHNQTRVIGGTVPAMNGCSCLDKSLVLTIWKPANREILQDMCEMPTTNKLDFLYSCFL